MNEFLKKFIMDTIIEMIDNNITEWEIRKYSLDWLNKGIFTTDDLMIINAKLNEKNTVINIVNSAEENEELSEVQAIESEE